MTSPATVPTIRVRRLDTNALVVTDLAMTEVGDGLYKYEYTDAVNSIEYSAVADGDPIDASQSTHKHVAGSGDTKVEETWKVLGLDRNDPMTVTPTTIDSDSGDVDVNLSGDGVASSRSIRQ